MVAGILYLVNRKRVKLVGEKKAPGFLGLGGGYTYKLAKLA